MRAFVLDPTCKWCPTWVQRNYEVLNDVLCGFPHEHMPFPEMQADAPDAGDASCDAKNELFPHASNFSTKFVFKSGEPDDKAEDEADETQAHERAVRDRWTNEDRPAWEKHSELGPNLNAEGSSIRREILQEVVNPEDHAYAENIVPLRLAAWQTHWDKLADSKTRYTDEALTKDGMGDDYQKLFVNILRERCDIDSVRFAKPAGPSMACLHCVGLRAAAGAVGLPVRRLADADRFRSAEIRCLTTSMCVFQPRGRCLKRVFQLNGASPRAVRRGNVGAVLCMVGPTTR